MQLSPHTLFNLLHTIRGHIEWDPKGAQSMVVQLADLLRRLLNAGERDFSRFADELQFVRLYLELQQRRFADRLTVVLPDYRDIAVAWVPSLILQPLVENAVVHGLAGHQGPVLVSGRVRSAAEGAHPARDQHHCAGQDGGAPTASDSTMCASAWRSNSRAARALYCGPRARQRNGVSEITLPAMHASPARSAARRADRASVAAA